MSMCHCLTLTGETMKRNANKPLPWLEIYGSGEDWYWEIKLPANKILTSNNEFCSANNAKTSATMAAKQYNIKLNN